MKVFDFLSAIAELGIFHRKRPNRRGEFRGFASFRNHPERLRHGGRLERFRGRGDLIAKIKDTPVACVQTENQFIFIYEME